MHLQIIDTTNTRSDGKVHSHQSITSPYFEVKDVKAERATMLRFTKHEQVCFTVRKHEIAPLSGQLVITLQINALHTE